MAALVVLDHALRVACLALQGVEARLLGGCLTWALATNPLEEQVIKVVEL